MEHAGPAKRCNALLIYPRFEADTFWNFTRTAEVFGAKYPAPPLGLITLAALLPPSWSVRLVNRNTEELSDDDLDWADLVLTGGGGVFANPKQASVTSTARRGLRACIAARRSSW